MLKTDSAMPSHVFNIGTCLIGFAYAYFVFAVVLDSLFLNSTFIGLAPLAFPMAALSGILMLYPIIVGYKKLLSVTLLFFGVFPLSAVITAEVIFFYGGGFQGPSNALINF